VYSNWDYIREHTNLLRKKLGGTLVHAHGCFDLFHYGHLQHLIEAKDMGDVLVVSVTDDGWVNKGFDRPVFTADQRVETLLACRYVDYAFKNPYPNAVEAIKLLVPNIFVKGPECKVNKTPGLLEEENAVQSVGGRLAYTNGTVFSSTDLVNKVLKFYA
jgi:cytidyltransferase-like protein